MYPKALIERVIVAIGAIPRDRDIGDDDITRALRDAGCLDGVRPDEEAHHVRSLIDRYNRKCAADGNVDRVLCRCAAGPDGAGDFGTAADEDDEDPPAWTDEEREWMAIPGGAEILRERLAADVAEHARYLLALAADIRRQFGEERFAEMLADPDPENDRYREIARSEEEQRRYLVWYEESVRPRTGDN